MILSGSGISRFLALSGLFLACIVASVANASECDELLSDSDTVICFDFDELSNCTTGREEDCFTDNGFTLSDRSTMSGMSIKSGGAYGGSGYLKGVGPVGGTDVGYMARDLPANVTSVNYRWAVRYDAGYMTYNLPHGPGTQADNGAGCHVGGTTEISQYSYTLYQTASGCSGISSSLYNPNVGSRPYLESGEWHVFEEQKIMNTSGANGQYRLWVDDVLVSNYSNMDFGGTQSPAAKFSTIWGPRHYYHAGWPRHSASISMDNFVVKTGLAAGTRIGGYASANSLGTGDGLYYADSLGDPYQQRHYNSDCSTPSGHKGIRDAITFRASATIVTTPVLSTGIEDECSAASKKALQTAVTNGNGSGYYFSRPNGGITSYLFPSWYVEDWIYMPSSNSYATATPQSGWIDYQNVPANGCSDLSWANYLTVCNTTGGNWGICNRACATSSAQTVIDSGRAITEDQYTGIAIFVNSDRTVTLDINETGDPDDWETIIDAVSVPHNIDYLFDTSGSNGPVIGVVNYSGSGTFTSYHADSAATSASLHDCKGWGETVCPFSETPPDPCDSDCTQCANEAACDGSNTACYWWSNNSCNASAEPEPTTPKGTALINWLKNKYPTFRGMK